MTTSELVTLNTLRPKRPKGVNRIVKKDKRGKVTAVRHYLRDGGRIYGEPGSDEFLENYLRLKKGLVSKSDGSLHGLITEYKASPEFGELASNTKSVYRWILDEAAERWEEFTISHLEEDGMVREIFGWRDELRDKPVKANMAIGVLKTLFTWAQKRRLIKSNPAQFVQKLKTESRKDKVWTQKQLGVFCDAAMPQLRDVFLAALFTGQRNGDVRKMKWSDYDGDWLHVKQEKTGAEVNLPVHKLQLLKQVIDIQPKVGPTIFTSPTGVAWTESSLHRHFKPIRIKAEAEDLHWHDLRGTLVTMLADAGCTEIQIAAITGHSVVKSQVGGYLNMSRNLAEEAYTRLHAIYLQKPVDYL